MNNEYLAKDVSCVNCLHRRPGGCDMVHDCLREGPLNPDLSTKGLEHWANFAYNKWESRSAGFVDPDFLEADLFEI